MHANTRRTIINRTCSVVLVLATAMSLATVCVGQVTFRSLSAQTTNSGNSLTLFKPLLTATGDLMIAAVVVDDGSFSGRDWTVPSGWTELDIGNCPNEPPRRCSMGVWWKIVPPGEVGSFDFSWGGSADPASGTILRYSGTDDSQPIGAVSTDSGVHKANSSDPPVAPSVTTTASDAVVLRIKGNDREGGSWTGDGSHVTRLNGCNPDSDPDLVCLTIADQSQATPGSAGSMTWLPAPNLTNVFWRSLSIEIQPPQPRGDIRVTKYVLPDSGVEMFDFTTTGLVPGSFGLSRGQTWLFPGVIAGSGLYSVSETVPEDFTRISYCDIGYAGNIEVVDGMTTQCTFVNMDETQLPRCDIAGAGDNTIGGGSNFFSYGFGLYFDAVAPFVLRAVNVYPGGAGDVVVNLKKDGLLLASRTVAVDPLVPGARTRIEIDLPVPAGSDYELDAVGTTSNGLYRNNSGASYPYIGEFMAITDSTNSTAGYYYFFYDWLFTPARVGWDVHLHDLTVDSAMTVRACGTATLGPDMDLLFPADVDVRAGESIVLESPLESGDNVLFGMAIDPALLPD